MGLSHLYKQGRPGLFQDGNVWAWLLFFFPPFCKHLLQSGRAQLFFFFFFSFLPSASICYKVDIVLDV